MKKLGVLMQNRSCIVLSGGEGSNFYLHRNSAHGYVAPVIAANSGQRDSTTDRLLQPASNDYTFEASSR